MTKFKARNKKIKEKGERPLPRIDARSIIILIAIALIVPTVIWLQDCDLFQLDKSKWTATTGHIVSVEMRSGASHGMSGSYVVSLCHLTIHYSSIDGKEYERTFKVAVSAYEYIKDFWGVNSPHPRVEIFYKNKNPRNARLNLDFNSDFYSRQEK